DPSDTPNSPRKMTYLMGNRRSCTRQGIFSCGTFSLRAMRLDSSCSAPKGHSQPQNGPRPQNSRATATEHQRMNTSGSTRKDDHWKPVRSELVKVSTFTTDSCACT